MSRHRPHRNSHARTQAKFWLGVAGCVVLAVVMVVGAYLTGGDR